VVTLRYLSFITLCRDLVFHLCLYDFFSFENRKDFVEQNTKLPGHFVATVTVHAC